MKFLLIAIGTRGDVEPFLAIGEMLIAKGHEVVCQFPEQFRELALNSNLQFEGLTPDFLEMIHSPDGKIVMGGGASGFSKLGALIRIYKKSIGVNHTMLMQQHKLVKEINPDRILYSSKATYSVVWEVLNPGKSIHVSPIPYLIHPTFDHGHIGVNGNYGKFLNRISYKFTNYFLAKNIVNSTKNIRKEIGVKSKAISKVLLRKKMVFTISPNFYKQQDYWPNNVKVLGYHERSFTNNWEPSFELTNFISSHKRILFVTFGSMTNPNPEYVTRMILRILRKNEIPAIINTAGGGLIQPGMHNSDLFHFVDNIPYEWILPKMHAIMHHGGSGTTHLAVKYGCASLIIPHIMDQYIWNEMNVKLGVGPKGIAIHKLSDPDLTLLILALFFSEKYKLNAQALSDKMKSEDYKPELLKFIEE